MELAIILALVVLGLGVYAFKRMKKESETQHVDPQPYDPTASVDPRQTRTEPDLWHKDESKPKPKPKKKKATKKKAKKKAKKKSSGGGGRNPNMTIADKK